MLEAVFIFISFRVFYWVNLTGLSMTFESSLLVEMSWAIKFVYSEKVLLNMNGYAHMHKANLKKILTNINKHK